MALVGKLEVKVEVKSSAEMFWGGIANSAELFPKIFPEQYKSIEIIEGDGYSVGTVRLIKYGEGRTTGIPVITFAKEKIEVSDDTNKLVTYSVVDGELTTLFKSFKATLHLVPKGDGALVEWTTEYEKMSDEVPEPNLFMDEAAKTFKELDAQLLLQA